MSIQAVAWVLDQYIPLPGPKLILVALANHADNKTGECYPPVGRIAQEASMSVRSAQRHLQWLEKNGFIRVVPSFAGGRQRANTYRLLMPALSATRGDNVTPLRPPHRGFVTGGGDTRVTPGNRHSNHQRTAVHQGRRMGHSSPPDQGRYEMEIARRWGEHGFEMLCAIPDDVRAILLRKQRDGTLDDELLAKIRLEHFEGDKHGSQTK